MNFSDILKTVKQGLEFAEHLKPLAEELGGPIVGTAFTTISSVVAIAENVDARIAEGKIVASSEDQAKLKRILKELATVNDELSRYISEH